MSIKKKYDRHYFGDKFKATIEKDMTFKYFDNPELFIGFRDTETNCDTCGQSKFCFDAEVFYGSDDLTSICPQCLEMGELFDIDAFTCVGDIKRLIEQLKQVNPSLKDDEIEEMAKRKTIELEKTNPHLITWQDWNWPCADGDYCKFIGYGSKPFYTNLANDTPVKDFFKSTFYEPEFYSEELWTEVLPVKLIKDFKDSSKYGTLFYVFKSLNSDKIITMWDCD